MGSPISRADVDRLAVRAHLELDDAEAEVLTHQLAEFLDYAQQVQQLPTDDVPPTTHVLTPRAPLRPDEPVNSLASEQALANAPDPDRPAGLFKVPRVMG
jgi:aspartyl-tRNA(Asn)/glutamyl-tRNA(Gln) amidotransferase subunit C